MRGFLRDERGTYATAFAVVLLPLFAGVGVAVDFTTASKGRAELTIALDAAVLAGARVLPSGETAAVDTATAFFAANYPHLLKESEGGGANPGFYVSEGGLHGDATRSVPTTFMSIMNIDSVPVAAKSAASSSGGGMELVMVLDVSGSMGGKGKIEALRSASVELIDTIYKTNETLPGTYVGIAPFSGRVNISAYEDGWIDPKLADTSGGGGKKKGSGTVVPGCTGLRSVTNRQNDAVPAVEKFPPFTGDSKVCPGPVAIGLTSQKSTIRNALLALYTGHGTSTQEGMAWGYRMLSPKWQGLWGDAALPLSYEETPRKIAVIMTDGENHPDQSGDSFSVSVSNDMLIETCTLMKANGVTVYSVAFDMGGALTSLYQKCASKPSYHYDAETNSELISAFSQIGSEINKGMLRLVY